MNTAKIMTRQMTLGMLLEGEIELPEEFDVALTGIEIDSRRIDRGDLFIACKGANHDGRDFVDDVIDKGAAAVLVEQGEKWNMAALRKGVPVVPVDKLACRIGKFAARFFDYPARELWLIGITGTNGKTSCCQFIAQALSKLGHKCGTSGTIGYGIYGENYIEDRQGIGPGTTPDPVTAQKILEEVKVQGADSMVMEVSSHGLKQNRVCVNDFDMAVFTNLSRDHLDYHGSMKAYGEEKLKLFAGSSLKVAVINMDDAFSAKILNSLSRNVRVLTCSLHNNNASVHARNIEFRPDGVAFIVDSPWGTASVNSPLLGSFNISNLLTVIAVTMAVEEDRSGFDFPAALAAISQLAPVKGRMEILADSPVSVVVDYAHSPDGLESALKALREHYQGRIWCVFGCGGERDKGKRPLMAEIAERDADKVVITDDNPRGEPSAVIIAQILAGISNKDAVIVESDRAKAIDYAIQQAAAGDVVLIAGKGHEEYQDIAGKRMLFSDVKQARISWQKRFNSN